MFGGGMKKYLITGVCGFVAEYMVNCLKTHEPDCDILGLARKDNPPQLDIHYQKVDLTEKDRVLNIVSTYQPDYIIHLAAISSVAQSWQTPDISFLNNTAGFLNLAESVRANGLKTRILTVGSSEEYGRYQVAVNEDFNLYPKSPYSVAKVAQEYLSKLYVDQFDLDIVMTRSFNHIGPKQNIKFAIPSFINQLIAISEGKSENIIKVGNIEVVRDFMDVRDTVEAYWHILHKGKKRAVYNVCSGNGIKLRDIIEIAGKELGVSPNIIVDKAKLRANEIPYIVGNNLRLKTELGWEPLFTLNDTISDIIKYIKTTYNSLGD